MIQVSSLFFSSRALCYKKKQAQRQSHIQAPTCITVAKSANIQAFAASIIIGIRHRSLIITINTDNSPPLTPSIEFLYRFFIKIYINKNLFANSCSKRWTATLPRQWSSCCPPRNRSSRLPKPRVMVSWRETLKTMKSWYASCKV